ncbi:MAG: metallophosphoesterase [Myxococcota bacterium]|nr:metallophosphoesterase [Myxococcota bacterium]
MVRKLLAMAVIALLLAAAFGLHLYIIDRLVVRTALSPPVPEVLTTLIWLGLAAIVVHPIAERLLPRAIGRWISLVGTTWMGIVFWLLLALAISDLFLAVGDELGFTGIGVERARAVGVAVLVAAAVVMGGYNAWRGPRDVRVEIELARWPLALDGYRIAQISDIHIGPALGRRFARELTRRVNALDADLVAVTGDLVDGRAHHLQDEVEPFAELRSRDGVFFVTGNHDHYSGANDWVDRVDELGMRALRNTSLRIERGAAGFTLAGVDDHRSKMMPGEGGEDLNCALDSISSDDATVLLAHDPSTFKRAHAMGIDLQLSGHTHGGQIWPFEYFVRLAVPFVAGRYRLGEAELYVSRGTGFWGPPLRLFAPAEITEIVLRAPPHASA